MHHLIRKFILLATALSSVGCGNSSNNTEEEEEALDQAVVTEESSKPAISNPIMFLDRVYQLDSEKPSCETEQFNKIIYLLDLQISVLPGK